MKVTCEGLNMTELHQVAHELSMTDHHIEYLNVRHSQLSLIEDNVLLDVNVAHLIIYQSSK